MQRTPQSGRRGHVFRLVISELVPAARPRWQAALNRGEWPDASRIRSEEFLNAFDYGDPMPTQKERVSCRIEQSIHPFLQQRNLLRVAMRPLSFVLVLLLSLSALRGGQMCA